MWARYKLDCLLKIMDAYLKPTWRSRCTPFAFIRLIIVLSCFNKSIQSIVAPLNKASPFRKIWIHAANWSGKPHFLIRIFEANYKLETKTKGCCLPAPMPFYNLSPFLWWWQLWSKHCTTYDPKQDRCPIMKAGLINMSCVMCHFRMKVGYSACLFPLRMFS